MKLLIVRGLSGSGKSTYARSLLSKGEYDQHEEADMFFYQNPDGKYRFDSNFIASAHRWCKNNVESGLIMGRNVIVSNTFCRKWEYQPYLDLAKQYGAEVEVYVCRGSFKSIHAPDEVVEKQKQNWEE